MPIQGTILLADDEDLFLEATKELLENEGYECHGVRDAHQLSQALTALNFDLLITDLNMPGNQVMEKVGEWRGLAKVMPVIIVTGYPSIPTAVESVRLNVLEYMIKPIKYPKLLDAVHRGVQQKKALNAIADARKEAEQRIKELDVLEEAAATFALPIGEQSLTADHHESEATPSMKDYFQLRESIFHTIQVLQKTKSAFRSKDLAGLRKYLEEVLRRTTELLKKPQPPTDTSLNN